MKKFAFKKIKEYREEAGISQLTLSKKVGVAVQQISAWENSSLHKTITVRYLGKIAAALGKTTDAFFV